MKKLIRLVLSAKSLIAMGVSTGNGDIRMTNAELFRKTFNLYATEVWAMSEQDFLRWLNSNTNASANAYSPKIRNLNEPTEKQVKYAKHLSEKAGHPLPQEYTKKAYSEFISKWKPIVDTTNNTTKGEKNG